MHLSTEDYIKLQLMRGGKLSVQLTGTEVILGEVEPPTDYKPQIIKEVMGHTLSQIAKEEVAYLAYEGNSFIIYKRQLVPVIFNDIVFVKWNSKGTPVVTIDGEEVSGYTNISRRLFGYQRSDIAQVIKPYLVKPFDKELLQFLELKTYMGRTYPVFKYKGYRKHIKGLAGIKAMFPQLTDEELAELQPQDLEQPLMRHEELIQKFDIVKVGDRFEIGGDLYFDSQRKVVSYIKEQGESISRETAKKLFESL